MSPNDHQSSKTTTPPQGSNEVANRSRTHLEALLRRRDRLAAIVAERVAHDLVDTDDFIMELLEVEQEIEDRWPAAYEQLAFTDWFFADMVRMHTPDEPLPTCGICSAVTAAPPPDRPGAPASGQVRDEAA